MPSIAIGETKETTYYVSAPNSGFSDAYGFRLRVKLNSQDISTNTSNITVTLDIDCRWSGAAWDGNTESYSTQISSNGGNKVRLGSGSKTYYSGSGRGVFTNLLSNTYNVSHNADGTCNFSIYCSNSGNGNWAPSAGSGSITGLVPPTIPRAASLSVTPTVIGKGTNMTVKVTPPNSTFTTTTTYKVGSNTITLASKVTGVRTFTVPYATLASYIGSYTSGVVTVTCQTYNGNTLIGTTSAQVTVQTGVIPMSWVDDRNGHVGVTVGQKASPTDYDFRVYLNSKFSIDGTNLSANLRDYVIEQGSSGI